MSLCEEGKQEPTTEPTSSLREGEEGVEEERKEEVEASKPENDARDGKEEEKAAEEAPERSHEESKAEEEKTPEVEEAGRKVEAKEEEIEEEAKEAEKQETEEAEKQETEEAEKQETEEAEKQETEEAEKQETEEAEKQETEEAEKQETEEAEKQETEEAEKQETEEAKKQETEEAEKQETEEAEKQETEETEKQETEEAEKEETEEVEEEEEEDEEAMEEDEPIEADKEEAKDADRKEVKEDEEERKTLDNKREADSDLALQVYTPKKRRRLSLPEGPGSKAAAASSGDVKGADGERQCPGQASSSSSSAAPPLDAPLNTNDWLAGSRGHYDVLGIVRSADLASVRKAYRRQALRTHPDKGGDTKDFLRVIGAFEVLSDRSRRAAYDADLDRQSCRDGQSAQVGTEEPEAPEDQRVLKEILSDARAAHMALLDSDPSTWHRQLSELSVAVLEALQSLPQLLEAGRKNSNRNRDAEEFPREIQPPDGLPQGWKCVEYMYHSGKSAGLTYVRYHSPWGKKRFQSIPSAIKADADWRHIDSSQAIAQLARRKVTKQPPAPVTRSASMPQRPIQRGIYTVRNAANISKYWVNVNWAYFRVYTRRTTSLAEAVDWHIAISNAKEVAQSRMRSQQGSKGGLATPMTRKELLELVQLEPGLNLIFSSNFSKGSLHNIYTPSTEDLETAVLIHQRFHRLLEQGRYSTTIINEERQRAFQEISAKSKELSILQCKLADAVAKELKRRRPSGLAVTGPPGTPREKLPAPSREDMAGVSLKHDERAGHQESSPSCSKDPLAGAKKAGRAAALPPDPGRDASADAQALVPASSTGGSSGSRSRQSHDKPDKRSAVQVALDFQNALGVDRKEAALLARAARALPPGEAKRRIQMLLEGSPHACQLALQAASALVLPQAAQQRRRAMAGGSGRARSRGRSGEPQRLALRGPSPARRGPSPARGALALPAPSAEPLALAPPENWKPPDGALLTSWWFLGLPAGITPVPWLDLAELCRFRAGCCGARLAADREFKDRFKHFKYVPGFMEPPLQLTRSGRPIVTNFTATGCAAERVLVRFLAKPHHARIFEEMDLSQAPLRALENQFLQGALNCMPYLKHIRIPWHGWSTSVARRCFLRSLPSRTSFESIDARGSVIERGLGDE